MAFTASLEISSSKQWASSASPRRSFSVQRRPKCDNSVLSQIDFNGSNKIVMNRTVYVLTYRFLAAWLRNGTGRFAREELHIRGNFNQTFWSVLLFKLPIVSIITSGTFLFRSQLLEFSQLDPSFFWLFPIGSLFLVISGLDALLNVDEQFTAAAWLQQIGILFNGITVGLMLIGFLPIIA